VTALFQSTDKGLHPTHPLIDPLDLLFPNEAPIISNLVRLVFHDCIGLNEYGIPICNGCLDLTNILNNAFELGSINPMEDICDNYADDGLSVADCWILGATIGLEIVAALSTSINNFELALKPGDIPYYYGREDCLNSPQNEDIFPDESFPKPTFYWEETENFFKNLFPSWVNKEIVALISGGHSLGRAHAKFSNFSGPWDISPQQLDNLYIKALLNSEPILQSNFTFFQGKIRSDLKTQWFVKVRDDLIQPIGVLPQKNLGLMFNADISMAFNLKKYSDKNNRETIDCVTDAYALCPRNSVVLIANNGQNSTTTNSNSNVCSYRQCPIQCPNDEITIEDVFSVQYQNINSSLQQKLSTVSPNSACTAAFILEYSKNNTLFVQDFVKIWSKLITTGYRNEQGEVSLNKII
jgi:hypothetical protein